MGRLYFVDRLLVVYSYFCMKLGRHEGTKVAEPDLKKALFPKNREKYFSGTFTFFPIIQELII